MPGMATSDWKSPCGVAYRTYDDGRIEVEGQGFPAWGLDSAQAKVVRDNIWGNYAGALASSAAKFGIPISWLVAIMAIESRGLKGQYAPCDEVCSAYWNQGQCASQGGPLKYCAGGLMQFTSNTAGIYGKTLDYYDAHPEEQIEDAADFLMNKKVAVKGGDLLAGVKAYNGGGTCADTGHASGPGIMNMYGQNDYIQNFVKYANTFVALALTPPMESDSTTGIGPTGQALVVTFCLASVAFYFLDIHFGITDWVVEQFGGPPSRYRGRT